jgi:hypothetical protein
MATTCNVITQFLKEEGYSFIFSPDSEYIETSAKTENYRNLDSVKSLSLFIKLEEDGRFIKVIAPYAYRCELKSGSNRKAHLFQSLLEICWKTKMVQFEYDSLDGEVRAIIEFPLEDSMLSKAQLMRTINSLCSVVDLYHEVIVEVLSSENDYLPKRLSEEHNTNFNAVLNKVSLGKINLR